MNYSGFLNKCWQAVNSRRNKSNELSQATSCFVRTTATASATGLVVASAGFGASYAWSTGSQHGPLLSGLSVLMALALEGAKPLAVASMFTAFGEWKIGRGLALGALAVVALGYSLSAELSLVASSRGDVVAARAETLKQSKNANGDAQRARDRYDLAKTALSTLAPARAVRELEAEIEGNLARLGHDCSVIEDKVSGRICKTVSAAKVELSRAHRRAELETVLFQPLPVSAAPVAGHVVQSADPGAEALSAYLALIGVTVSAASLSELLILVPVLALEAGSALAAVLVAAYAPAGRTPVPAPAELAAEVSAPTPPKPKRRRNRTPDDQDGPPATGRRVLGDRVVRLVRSEGGSFKGGQRRLADVLGVARSTLNELLADLADTGEIILNTTRSGSEIRLAA